jgi:hypothetical protein
LLIITLLGIGAMYLTVSAKAADAGREVLTLEDRRQDLLQINAELTSRLALLTTPERMMARASEMGFRPAEPGDVEYIKVEGYRQSPPFLAPQPAESDQIGNTTLSPAYTETLGDWFSRVIGEEESE